MAHQVEKVEKACERCEWHNGGCAYEAKRRNKSLPRGSVRKCLCGRCVLRPTWCPRPHRPPRALDAASARALQEPGASANCCPNSGAVRFPGPCRWGNATKATTTGTARRSRTTSAKMARAHQCPARESVRRACLSGAREHACLGPLGCQGLQLTGGCAARRSGICQTPNAPGGQACGKIVEVPGPITEIGTGIKQLGLSADQDVVLSNRMWICTVFSVQWHRAVIVNNTTDIN